MKKIIILSIAILFNSNSFSQSFFINTGKNNTSYNYTNSDNQEVSELRRGVGLFVEAGVNIKIKSKKDVQRWSYSLGLIVNQFNSNAYINSSDYSWETEYFGVKNNFIYRLTKNESGLNLNLNSGFSFLQIISGTQRINNTFYDLKNNSEFKGVFVEPHIGATLSYNINNKTNFYFGYNISEVKRIKGKTTGENLNGFDNQRVYLGFNLKI